MAVAMLKSPLRRFCSIFHCTVNNSLSRFETKNLLLGRKMIKTNQLRYCCTKSKMVTLIFEKPDGTRLERQGKIGDTVQQVIGKDNPDFPGYAECDGTLSCSCCHVILSKEDYDKFYVKQLNTKEEDLILSASINPTPTSRLGCCLTIVPAMDGIVLKLPAEVKDIKQN